MKHPTNKSDEEKAAAILAVFENLSREMRKLSAMERAVEGKSEQIETTDPDKNQRALEDAIIRGAKDFVGAPASFRALAASVAKEINKVFPVERMERRPEKWWTFG